MTLEERVFQVREQIAKAAQKSGRSEKDIQLMAVTKTRTVQEIDRALTCGISLIGENKAQELCAKYSGLAGKCRIHFIGHLQTNKISRIFDKVDLIESLDSVHLADALEHYAAMRQKTMDVLVQVNTGAEEAKGGFLFEELNEFLGTIPMYPHLRVRGLMAVAPKDSNERMRTIRLFDKMFRFYIDNQKKKVDNMCMEYLSMGMSQDFDLAVEHGANLVRIGTGIFEPRNV